MWVEINPELLLLLRRELLDGFEDLLIGEFNPRHELFSLLCFRDRSPEYRKYKATFHASSPSGASQHPASDHPAPLGATPQPRQSASGAALQAASRSPEGGGSIAAGRRMTAPVSRFLEGNKDSDLCAFPIQNPS